MLSRMKWQTLYKKQLAYDMLPLLPSDGPLVIYDIQVTIPPVNKTGWVIIDYTVEWYQDLIFYHDIVSGVLKYYKKDRDLLWTWAWLKRHLAGATVQINDNAEWYNYLSNQVDDFWFVQQWYNWSSALAVKINWGNITYNDVSVDIADATLVLSPSVTSEIVLDYTDNVIKVFTDPIGDLKWVRLATVITGASTINSITDMRRSIRWTFYSSTFFQFVTGELSLKDGIITTAKLVDWSVTTAKIADDNVTTAKIAPLAVWTAELNNVSVTTAKIANKAVTSDKIEDNPIFNNTFRLPELWSDPLLPVAWELRFFVKNLLWIPTAHSIDSNWVVTPLGVNPIIVPGSSVMVWPIAWTNWSNTTTFSDPSALLASSKVTWFYPDTWTINGLVVECEVTADWQITFKSYNNAWSLQTETSVMFYYSIIY